MLPARAWLPRRHGIAARYLSGYLFAPDGEDEQADSAEVDTNAVNGVFRGGAGAELSASVTMTRTDPAPARA